MSTYSLTLRQTKGSKLSIEEMDNNMLYLQQLAMTASGPQGTQGRQGPMGFDGANGLQGPIGPNNMYFGTSSTYLAIPSYGDIVDISVQPNLSYVYNQWVVVYNELANFYDAGYDEVSTTYSLFIGSVNSYSTYSGTLSIVTQKSIGVGKTYSLWYVNLSGAMGTRGLQGNDGSIGATGAQGSTGAQGNTGPQGINGVTGSQGATGAQGSYGPTGYQGPTGPQGIYGATGPQGYQGSVGAVGPAGLVWKGLWSSSSTYSVNDTVGFTGASWFCIATVSSATISNPYQTSANWALLADQGAPGVQGDQGSIGAQGVTGPQGVQGIQGVTGPQGFGLQGPTGSIGVQGVTGPQGPLGITGPQGTQGPAGDGSGMSNIFSLTRTNDSSLTGATADSFTLSTFVDNVNAVGITFSTSTGRATVLSSGYYYINANLIVDSSITQNLCTFTVKVNGVSIWSYKVRIYGSGVVAPSSVPISLFKYLNANDYVNILAQPTSGTLTIKAGSTFNVIAVSEIGPMGNTGSQGATGPQGSTGVGVTGSQGVQGAQGVTGPQGTQGQGITGSQGSQGTQGTQGTQGSVGPQGYIYVSGATYGGVVISDGATGLESSSSLKMIGNTFSVYSEISLLNTTNLQQTTEVITDSFNATASYLSYNFSNGSIWYHATASTNFSINFTNLPTINSRVITSTIMINQGLTAYSISSLQINGVTQSIRWANGSTPSATASRVSIYGFTFIRTESIWKHVFGQMNNF